MKKISLLTVLALFASAMLQNQSLSGVGIIMTSDNGEKLYFDVDPQLPVGELLYQVQNESTAIHFDFWDTNAEGDDELVCKANQLREYSAPVSRDIEADMKFIVLTLGNEPLLKLKGFKDDLKKAGERLDEIHPLHFWRIIFTDEKAMSAMHNIKRRKKVWKSFIKGMGQSLQEAHERENLKVEYLEDFASKVGIDVDLITKQIQKCDWSEFAKQLLVHVPRSSNIDRYDQ